MVDTLFPFVRETSRGKTIHFRSMYPHHLRFHIRIAFGLRLVKQTHPVRIRLMMFVFLGLELCFQLPSDSTSRWTPLLLANGWSLSPPITDFHRQVNRHAWRTYIKTLKGKSQSRFTSLFFTYLNNFFGYRFKN